MVTLLCYSPLAPSLFFKKKIYSFISCTPWVPIIVIHIITCYFVPHILHGATQVTSVLQTKTRFRLWAFFRIFDPEKCIQTTDYINQRRSFVLFG